MFSVDIFSSFDSYSEYLAQLFNIIIDHPGTFMFDKMLIPRWLLYFLAVYWNMISLRESFQMRTLVNFSYIWMNIVLSWMRNICVQGQDRLPPSFPHYNVQTPGILLHYIFIYWVNWDKFHRQVANFKPIQPRPTEVRLYPMQKDITRNINFKFLFLCLLL